MRGVELLRIIDRVQREESELHAKDPSMSPDIHKFYVERWERGELSWAHWGPYSDMDIPGVGVLDYLPEESVDSLRAVADGLIAEGLLTGCTCGCRGDLEVTDEGRSLVESEVEGAAGKLRLFPRPRDQGSLAGPDQGERP